MKYVKAYIDPSNNLILETTTGDMHIGPMPSGTTPTYHEEVKQTNIVELVATGMTADDLIKLKHGGVL